MGGAHRPGLATRVGAPGSTTVPVVAGVPGPVGVLVPVGVPGGGPEPQASMGSRAAATASESGVVGDNLIGDLRTVTSDR